MKVPYTVRRFAVLFLICAVGCLIVFPLSEMLFAEGVFHWTVKAHLVSPMIIALLYAGAMTFLEARENK